MTVDIYACASAAADVDGDGGLDILTVSRGNNKAAWFENNGDDPPSFSPRIICATAMGICSIAAADMDGDGDLDDVAAIPGEKTVSWFENSGKPAYGEWSGHPVVQGQEAVKALTADFDGDGDTDVAAVFRDASAICIYSNDGGNRPPLLPNVWLDLEAAIPMRSLRIWITTAILISWRRVPGTERSCGLIIPAGWTAGSGASHLAAGGLDGPRGLCADDADGDGDVDIYANACGKRRSHFLRAS